MAATASGRPIAASGATLPPRTVTVKSTESVDTLSAVSGSSPLPETVPSGVLASRLSLESVPEISPSKPPGSCTCRPSMAASRSVPVTV